jgi:hypothetical protein
MVRGAALGVSCGQFADMLPHMINIEQWMEGRYTTIPLAMNNICVSVRRALPITCSRLPAYLPAAAPLHRLPAQQ